MRGTGGDELEACGVEIHDVDFYYEQSHKIKQRILAIINAAQIAQKFIQAGVVAADEIEGFSPEEIDDVKNRLGLRLPDSCREFLLVMGHRFGRISNREGLFLRDVQQLINLQSFATELFEESATTFRLPDDALVISQHDGYQFIYLRTAQGDDSPAFLYMEGSDAPKVDAPDFLAHLTSVLQQHMPKRSPEWRRR
jgi:hypothetical protein